MEKDLLEELYLKYASSLYLYALSLCRHKETAEDLVSSSFEKAFLYENIEGGQLKYWLLTVCRNLWIDKLRRRKLCEKKSTLLTAPDEEDPLSSILLDERDRKLYEHIRRLPKPSQELLILHYFTGISVKEIAALLGIGYSNAKISLFRARIQLKRYLEEDDYEF